MVLEIAEELLLAITVGGNPFKYPTVEIYVAEDIGFACLKISFAGEVRPQGMIFEPF